MKAMKKLIVINGTMGAGKTAASQALLPLLSPAVRLEGDWCWDMEPFTVTQETKALVMQNITFLLRSFLSCSAWDSVIFSWVLHEASILEKLLEPLASLPFETMVFTLVCTPQTLAERIGRDVAAGLRKPDVLERSLERLPLYEKMDTIHIQTDRLPPEEIARMIALAVKDKT